MSVLNLTSHKSYIPKSHIMTLIVIYYAFPIGIGMIIRSIGIYNKLAAYFIVLACGMALIGPFALYRLIMATYAIHVKDGMIINRIGVNHLYYWEKEIKQIQKITIISNTELRQYFEFARAQKALWFEFDDDTYDYIDITPFDERTIQKLIAHIEEIKKSYDNQDPS